MEKKRMKYRQRQNFFKTDAWKRFRKNKLALVGTAVILLLILAAVFAPVLRRMTRMSACRMEILF